MVKADNYSMRREFDMELESYKKIIGEMEMQRMQGESEGYKNTEKIEGIAKVLKETEKKLALTEVDLRKAKEQVYANEVLYSQKIQAIENELRDFRRKDKLSAQRDRIVIAESVDISYTHTALNEMLNLGKSCMSSLKVLSPEYLTLKEKLGYLLKLLKKVITESSDTANKYNKLLDLHNQLIEVSNSEEIFNPKKLAELAEDNAKVKQQLEAIHRRYE
eukprot:TRINITY_DN6593_c0_g3_i2.p1 TRINITY_DN6593_c0_g3~~TRINITY_DN6593_c0_g3_i2.p1  ORF type:complete len:219 (+),score=66.29 TRINITY_DN6593_c0_g3_i2:491-1147(+)